jgi:hypothetical protein
MAQFPSTSYSYKNIATSATTVVKANAGVLHGVYINSAAATAVITFYDNASAASGTKIATMTIGTGGILFPAAKVLSDINFANGLTIVTATAAVDITVLYA